MQCTRIFYAQKQLRSTIDLLQFCVIHYLNINSVISRIFIYLVNILLKAASRYMEFTDDFKLCIVHTTKLINLYIFKSSFIVCEYIDINCNYQPQIICISIWKQIYCINLKFLQTIYFKSTRLFPLIDCLSDHI